jgi:tRNA threonylcarbamoyladenosine biosynthesis protein TsaE
MEWKSNSPEETQRLGQQLMELFPDATVVCLKGPLGSGKTCFVKGVGTGLGIEKQQIKSPTFTTLLEHHGNKKLFHLDFYRHESPEDLSVEWWRELLEHPDSIVVAEWPENIQPHLPAKRLEIEFIDQGGDERLLILKEHNE